MTDRRDSMTFYQIADKLYEDNRMGGVFDADEIAQAADAILEGYRDEEDALCSLDAMGETGNIDYTAMGWPYDADTLYKAIVVKWGKEVLR